MNSDISNEPIEIFITGIIRVIDKHSPTSVSKTDVRFIAMTFLRLLMPGIPLSLSVITATGSWLEKRGRSSRPDSVRWM